MKAIRYRAPQIRDVLDNLAKSADDAIATSEVDTLARHGLENFEFLVGMVIWYNLLFVINKVSKFLQSEEMYIDVAIE